MPPARFPRTVFPLSPCLVIWFTTVCYANMLYFDESSQRAINRLVGEMLLVMFVLTVIIECMVVCVVLWSRWRPWLRIMGNVGLVNLITFPPTQIAWLAVNGPLLRHSLDLDAVLTIPLLEVLVTLAEFFLLRWRLGHLWRRGVLDKPVSNGRLIVATVAANAASFVLGFALVAGARPFGFLPIFP